MGGTMCGITGFVDRHAPGADQLRGTVESMTATLHHRGPDDTGCWVDESAGVAFGHCRLAVLDLSEHGHQPMHSGHGRYVLNYNGEIYNFAEVRSQLEAIGTRFRGSGDTEVLVAAIERWGLVDALGRCNGMFALALWDRQERTLSLARDRMGEKPLYYGWSGGRFLFGSELKAVRAHPAFDASVDRDALTLYLRHNCVPAPYSIYQGIRKLPPGTTLTLSEAQTQRPGQLPEPRPYWSLAEAVTAGTSRRFDGGVDAATDDLDALLRDAVGIRTYADVPLGAFLSGGIDSSLIAALMQAQATSKVKTFTVAFDDRTYNEAGDAQRVAAHLGTEHTELLVSHDDALEVVPSLGRLYDEPFSDSSQLPTYLLSRLTREHVTVALSGDGGDELFGGYNRYRWASGTWDRLRRIPQPLRAGLGSALDAVPPRWWDGAYQRVEPALPRRLRVRMPGNKVQKMAGVLGSDDLADLHLRLASHVQHPERLVLGGVEPPSLFTGAGSPRPADAIEQMMYLDSVTYLPDDILVKVDRASMAVSLEARVPFLDHRVVEMAWRLPSDMKIRGGTGKWLLRRLLHRYVPAELVERPKMGFGAPIGSWLRGPLRPWAEDLLSESRLRSEGYFAPAPVRRLWDEHQSGRRERQYELWDILMFQVWLAESRSTATFA
jgi:asparagine synthase (glutamine-hydrolysing)